MNKRGTSHFDMKSAIAGIFSWLALRRVATLMLCYTMVSLLRSRIPYEIVTSTSALIGVHAEASYSRRNYQVDIHTYQNEA